MYETTYYMCVFSIEALEPLDSVEQRNKTTSFLLKILSIQSLDLRKERALLQNSHSQKSREIYEAYICLYTRTWYK